MTAGTGSDNFVSTLFATTDGKVGTQGFDVIKNFNVNSDTLSFGNLVDRNGDHTINMADLQASITLTHNGADSVLTFDGGGSLTLSNVNLQSLSDLHTQLSATHIVV
jgi:hypothetical protein